MFRVAFKPPATIGKAQNTSDFEGAESVLSAKGRYARDEGVEEVEGRQGSGARLLTFLSSLLLFFCFRHDPCVVPRAVPIVEAMAALVLADAAMIQLARSAAMVSFLFLFICYSILSFIFSFYLFIYLSTA